LFQIYIIKEFVQPKLSLNREFLIWKDRGRGVREREGWVGRESYLRLSLGETEGRDRDKET
jgi:hypothetical protein